MKVTIVNAPRPETKEEEDIYFLRSYRWALEECLHVMQVAGSPNLLETPVHVLKMMKEYEEQLQELEKRVEVLEERNEELVEQRQFNIMANIDEECRIEKLEEEIFASHHSIKSPGGIWILRCTEVNKDTGEVKLNERDACEVCKKVFNKDKSYEQLQAVNSDHTDCAHSLEELEDMIWNYHEDIDNVALPVDGCWIKVHPLAPDNVDVSNDWVHILSEEACKVCKTVFHRKKRNGEIQG